MLKELDDYDWQEAFSYADFSREDVKEIIYMIEGENDGDEWCGVFLLNDGRYGTLHAGCDYTGWDCQAGGDSYTADDLRTAILGGLDESDRKRMGIDTDSLILPQAPETTEILNEVKADKGILTEEELKERNRLLVLENDEQLAENTKLKESLKSIALSSTNQAGALRMQAILTLEALE